MSRFRNFIDLNHFSDKELVNLLDSAISIKKSKSHKNALLGKNFVMVFEKTSTRTRISFEVAINDLGGNPIFMNSREMQISKGESFSDTAKVLSSMADCVILRVNSHDTILEFAQNSSVPIINALSDFSHPCQIMASLMTIVERFGSIAGKKLSWFGEANNVLVPYIHAAHVFGYELAIASPTIADEIKVEIDKASALGAKISWSKDAKKCANMSDVLITDTWFSMGDKAYEDEVLRAEKMKELESYRVTKDLMSLANKDAIFTHCLPAYRGIEVDADVIDSDASIVFEEAANRVHAQKAIILFVFGLL